MRLQLFRGFLSNSTRAKLKHDMQIPKRRPGTYNNAIRND
jgi:hypothetical protein